MPIPPIASFIDVDAGVGEAVERLPLSTDTVRIVVCGTTIVAVPSFTLSRMGASIPTVAVGVITAGSVVVDTTGGITCPDVAVVVAVPPDVVVTVGAVVCVVVEIGSAVRSSFSTNASSGAAVTVSPDADVTIPCAPVDVSISVAVVGRIAVGVVIESPDGVGVTDVVETVALCAPVWADNSGNVGIASGIVRLPVATTVTEPAVVVGVDSDAVGVGVSVAVLAPDAVCVPPPAPAGVAVLADADVAVGSNDVASDVVADAWRP